MSNYNISKIYQDMEISLIESMKRNLSRHLDEEIKEGFEWKQWQAEKLKELKRYQRENKNIVGAFSNQIDKELSKKLKTQFREGNKSAQKTFKKALKHGYKFNKKLNRSFFGINDRKVTNLITSVDNDLKVANYATLRMMDDVYREVIHKSAMFAGNGVMTEKQAIDMATKDFLNRGINCIEYSNGARVNIANYSKMAVRTAENRAFLQGEGEFRKKVGNPLIKITKHGTACKLCQPWEDKILIDDVYSGGSSKDGKYQLLSTAMKMGLYHPNCFHGNGTYYSELDGLNLNDNIPENEMLVNYISDINYCNQQIQRFSRLEAGSLDKINIQDYQNKKEQWKIKKKDIITAAKTPSKPVELTYDEKYAINTYLGPDSYKINEKLRWEVDLSDADKIFIKNLDSALDKMEDYSGDITRSVSILNGEDKDIFLKNYKIGEITKFNEYLSTTSGDSYNPEARIQMYIKSLHGKDIRKHNELEQEILFKRGAKFKVIDIDTNDDFFVKIYMEEIE